MRYAVRGKNRTYHYRVGMIPYIRFLLRCRIQYAVRQNESEHVAINAASEHEFGWGKLRNDVTEQGIFIKFEATTITMPRSKVSEETTEKLIELVRQHLPLFDAKCP